MTITLKQFLAELSFVEIKDIKRHSKGLLLSLEKSNRKEFLKYVVMPENLFSRLREKATKEKKMPLSSRS